MVATAEQFFTEDVAKPEPRRRRKDLLGWYFSAIGRYSLFDRESEADAAWQCQALDRAVWLAVLSRPEAIKPIAAIAIEVLTTELPVLAELARRLRGRRKPPAKAIEAAAEELRAADPDRTAIVAVLRWIDDYARERPSDELDLYREQAHLASSASVACRNHIASANLRLVARIAREFDHSGAPLEDRIQEGNVGMLRAIGRFDPIHGVRFATYAIWWIRNAIWRHVNGKERTVRVPAHVRAQGHRVLSTNEDLMASLGRPPTIDETSKATEMSPRKLERLRFVLSQQVVSLEQPAGGGDEDLRLIDRIEGRDPDEPSFEDTLARRQAMEVLYRLTDELPDTEAAVIRRRFGLDGNGGATLAEIGQELGLSRERIRQVQNQAVSRLRRMLKRSSRPLPSESAAALAH